MYWNHTIQTVVPTCTCGGYSITCDRYGVTQSQTPVTLLELSADMLSFTSSEEVTMGSNMGIWIEWCAENFHNDNINASSQLQCVNCQFTDYSVENELSSVIFNASEAVRSTRDQLRQTLVCETNVSCPECLMPLSLEECDSILQCSKYSAILSCWTKYICDKTY